MDIDASLGSNLKQFSFNFQSTILNKMLDSGYAYGRRVYAKIFEHGYGNLDGIRQSVSELYDQEFDERMRVTALARIVTFLNFFTQLFRSKHSVKLLLKQKNPSRRRRKR